MRKIYTLLSLLLLTNCSMPLVSSLGGSAVTGVVSGKATHSLASAGVDVMMWIEISISGESISRFDWKMPLLLNRFQHLDKQIGYN